MKFFTGRIVCFCSGLLALPAFAQLSRVPNNTLTNLPPQPPVLGYAATNAFGNLTFTNPIAIVTPPGETNRLFVVEQGGRIAVITNLAAPTRSTFLDISSKIVGGAPSDERGLLGLAFHPGYATNGFFFIDYTSTNAATTVAGGTNSLHDIVARYQVSSTNANFAPTNETRLIVQFDQQPNHNGGDLHFGPDGYLYVSLGDEGGGDDSEHNSQLITNDFFSGMLRLDVDKTPGSLAPRTHPASTTNYAVPPDNPFIGRTNFNGFLINSNHVHTEFWAVGLRNPWRYSFDPQTGRLYCGDVGQGAREEIDIITRGSNYGWNYREGFIARPGSGTPPAGFSPTEPIFDYTHGSGTNQGFAIIGGIVYRGARISQLNGAYVFGDNGSGNIWSLRYDGTNVSEFKQLFGGENGVSSFGVDPRNGDVLWTHQSLDTIRRLIYSTNITGTPLPPTLADTGAFSSVANLTPNPGIVPYDLNVPFWSDNAIKTRWFSLPNTNLAIGFNADGNWSFPTGTVWIKHFELELTNDVPASHKRLETRLLVKNSSGIYGVTYRWGNSTTNATLVPEEGLDENFIIDEGGGILRTQVWHYPSRSECLICHTPVAGFALGFNTAQLNRNFDSGSGATNQIAALNKAGYFSNNVANIQTLRALASATNTDVSLEHRVRSYLVANCVQCHQPGGSAQAMWDARIITPTEQAGLINGALYDNAGNTSNRVIAPSSLTNSMLLTRLANFGSLHMPPLDTSVINTQAVALLSLWITNDLPNYKTFADWQLTYFSSTNSANSATNADPDGDGNNNQLEFLTGSIPTNNADVWKISIAKSNAVAEVTFLQIANRGFEVQFATNLVSPVSWQVLDVPANAPFFAASTRMNVVPDAVTNSTKFYRARIFTP